MGQAWQLYWRGHPRLLVQACLEVCPLGAGGGDERAFKLVIDGSTVVEGCAEGAHSQHGKVSAGWWWQGYQSVRAGQRWRLRHRGRPRLLVNADMDRRLSGCGAGVVGAYVPGASRAVVTMLWERVCQAPAGWWWGGCGTVHVMRLLGGGWGVVAARILGACRVGVTMLWERACQTPIGWW